MNKQEKIITTFIGAIIGTILIVFGSLWLYEGSFTLTIAKYSTFFNFFLTAIIALITFLYFLATKRIVEKTSESVELTYRSLNLSAEKEKNERTLFYLEKIDFENLAVMSEEKTHFSKGFERDLIKNITFLDTIGALYKKGKLDNELIFPKLAMYSYDFF